MALLHTPCGTGGGILTSESPEPADLAQAVRAEMVRLQMGVSDAQAAANRIYTRSPFDFQDLGLNIFADVARTNGRGAGGPSGVMGPMAYSAPGVPFGPAAPSPLSEPTEERAQAVELVPLEASASGVRQPKLTTTQGLDVPAVPRSWEAVVKEHYRRLAGGSFGSGPGSPGIRARAFARANAALRRMPPIFPVSPLAGKRLADQVRQLDGAPYPAAGSYPVSCASVPNASPADRGTTSISGWWWLALALGLGLAAASGSGQPRERRASRP